MNTQNFIRTVDFNQDYNKFIEYLFSLKDDEYKKFNQKIVKTDNIIGIRLPILKNIAKTIAKNDYLSFIKKVSANVDTFFIMWKSPLFLWQMAVNKV